MYLPVSMPATAARAVGAMVSLGPADDDFTVNREPPHPPAALKRMSQDWIEKDWKSVKELYGCGQYAKDSDEIFYQGCLELEPQDGELLRYINFAKEAKCSQDQ